jgi:hypothetical protein
VTTCVEWRATYSYGGKNILELVYECNKPWVIDVDAVNRISIPRCEGLSRACAYAFGFVAMAGESEVEVVRVCVE